MIFLGFSTQFQRLSSRSNIMEILLRVSGCLGLYSTLWFRFATLVSICPCPLWILIVRFSVYIFLSLGVCSFVLMFWRPFFSLFFCIFSLSLIGDSWFFYKQSAFMGPNLLWEVSFKMARVFTIPVPFLASPLMFFEVFDKE